MAAFVGLGLARTTVGEGLSVGLSLATDRSDYYVGQPVRLELVVANHGDTPIHGFLLLEPWLPPGWKTASLLYCGDAGCQDFALSMPNEAVKSIHVPTIELGPGGQQRSRVFVAWDERRSQLVLNEPGEYELRWTTTGIFSGPKRRWDHVSRGPELSASVRVKVHPVPPSEEPAFEHYRALRLARIAQYDSRHSLVGTDEVQGLLRFLKEFPTSIYTDTLRDGAAGLLENEIRGGRLPAKDKAFVDEYLASLRSPVR